MSSCAAFESARCGSRGAFNDPYRHFSSLFQVMSRVPGVTVTPHHGRIEDKGLDFYEQFHVIILGLDSLEARRYMNSVVCSLLGAALRGI